MSGELLELQLGDEPRSWSAAGFVLAGPNRDAVVLDGVVLRLVGRSKGVGILAWHISGVADEIDGLSSSGHVPILDELPHPNGVSSIDHIVVETFDFDRSIRAFNAAGLNDRRTRKFLVGGSERQQTFFWAGSVIVETIGEVKPTGEGPSVLWGLALVSEDLESTAQYLGDLISRPKAAVQSGRQIATLRTTELDISMPVAVMTPHGRST
ncbi:MAG: hypothetical protein V3V01_12710 [Acidimicrobiales bacterium]